MVDVDIALPGRDEPLGVTSPDRDPIRLIKWYLQEKEKEIESIVCK